MPIRPSTASDVSRLLGELSSMEVLRREMAVARLAVIGARAVTRLIEVAADEGSAPHARLAAVSALQAIADARALTLALELAANTGDLGLAAIGVLGAIARLKDPRAAKAFDRLAALAMNAAEEDGRRVAALNALEGVPEKHLQPIFNALAQDTSPGVQARATRRAAGEAVPLESLLERGLPDDPALAGAVVRDEADTAKLTTLRRAIDAVRERERSSPSAQQHAWAAVRGQVHQALAGRKSRLGLFDLRDTLAQATGTLPVGFLTAAAAIGDAGCLDSLASAWTSTAASERWWREHLADAFRAIVTREQLTRRHPVLKRILERHPQAGVLVGMARK